MEKKSLTIALVDTLKEESVGCIAELVEVGLDSIMEEGTLKEIPIVSTFVSLYKIGDSLMQRHNLKKLAIFLNEINEKIANDEKRREYRQKLMRDVEFAAQEIEYILILIDRYINYDKPKMLAKLYLAYLDGIIVWEEMTMYAEIVDRIFTLDKDLLLSGGEEIIVHRSIGDESVLRLVALGLMTEVTDVSLIEKDQNGGYSISIESIERSKSFDKKYRKTEFGEKLAEILR